MLLPPPKITSDDVALLDNEFRIEETTRRVSSISTRRNYRITDVYHDGVPLPHIYGLHAGTGIFMSRLRKLPRWLYAGYDTRRAVLPDSRIHTGRLQGNRAAIRESGRRIGRRLYFHSGVKASEVSGKIESRSRDN